MGRRDRERRARIRRGDESSFKDQQKLAALERVTEQFPGHGEDVAEVMRRLARLGRLRI